MFLKYCYFLVKILHLSVSINNGNYATIQQFPHQVAILANDSDHFFCGGSALSHKHILTAAHCVYWRGEVIKKSPVRIIAGHHDITNKSAVHRHVKNSICHKCYGWRTYDDICILLLNKELPTGIIRFAKIIKYWPKDVKNANISGWAKEIDHYKIAVSTHLKYVEIRVYSPHTCSLILLKTNKEYKKHPGLMCVGDRLSSNEKNLPNGRDSGGNLIIFDSVSIGVLLSRFWYKYGPHYPLNGKPGVLLATNTTYYYRWIKRTMKKLV